MTGSNGAKWPEARKLAELLVEQTGGTVRFVLMYGSHLLRTNPDRHSALDFVVIVDDYRGFYSALASSGGLHRPVGMMTALAGFLAPNAMAYAPNGIDGRLAKCLVVTKADFARALDVNPPDHFLLGRMVQQIGVLWASDPSEEQWVQARIKEAQLHVLDWMAPYLDEPVDAPMLGRRLLEVCYQGELRPESRGRSGRVFDAQAGHFAEVLTPALERACTTGVMKPEGELFALTKEVSAYERGRVRWYFRRSKARTTARWFKHIMTFANWLPYIVRKVERHTGRTIQLSPLERSAPLIFLWPRAFYVLMTRPRREIEP